MWDGGKALLASDCRGLHKQTALLSSYCQAAACEHLLPSLFPQQPSMPQQIAHVNMSCHSYHWKCCLPDRQPPFFHLFTDHLRAQVKLLHLSIAPPKEGRKECSNCKWDPTKPIWVPFLIQQQHSSSKTSPQEEEEEEGIRKKQEMDSGLFFFSTTTSLNPKFFNAQITSPYSWTHHLFPSPSIPLHLILPQKKGKAERDPKKHTHTIYTSVTSRERGNMDCKNVIPRLRKFGDDPSQQLPRRRRQLHPHHQFPPLLQQLPSSSSSSSSSVLLPTVLTTLTLHHMSFTLRTESPPPSCFHLPLHDPNLPPALQIIQEEEDSCGAS